MKTVKILVVLLSFIILSCETEDEKMVRYITGNWETVYGKLEMQTYQNKDTVVEYDIDFANPDDKEAIRQGKPYSTYKADGTFKSWTEKNNRPTGQSTSGKWRATKDSLYWDLQQNNKTFTVSFGLELVEDGFAVTSMQDGDRDGKVDDLLYLETVRLPDNEKE